MSLLIHERQIRRAVAGELSASDEDKLRAHLRRCERCRARYDVLARAAEALAVMAGRPSRAQFERARARLVAALPEPGPLPPQSRRPRRWQLGMLALLAPVAALVIWLVRPSDLAREIRTVPAPSDVQSRGAATEEPAGQGSLVIYAARKRPGGGGGPLRMVAELPGSGEGRVSLSDYVAFGVRDLKSPAFITIAGLEDDGTVHIYLPRPSGAPLHAEAGPQPTVFSPSINLAASQRPGRLTIRALLSPAPLDANTARRALVEDAKREATAKNARRDTEKPLVVGPPSIVMGGLLTIDDD